MAGSINSIFLILSVFLFLSYFFGNLLSKLYQPKVISDILVGILLGPSFFGIFFPEFFQQFLLSDEFRFVTNLKEVGLVLLMFCSGYEINHLDFKSNSKVIFLSVLLGVGMPIAFSIPLFNSVNLDEVVGLLGSYEKVKIVLALSAAVTSIPVISRILLELNLIHTPFARLILSVAIADDLFLYAILNALLLPYTAGESSAIWISSLKHVVVSAVFLTFIIFARFRIYRFARLTAFKNGALEKYQYLTLIFASLFLVVFIASSLGITSMISSFACGLIVASANTQQSAETGEEIKRFSFSAFIPIYFILVGFKINLQQDFSFYWLALFLVSSSLVKILAGFLAGKAAQFKSFQAFAYGIALNTRGGPGIVIATLALDSKIINGRLFVTLVLTSLITSSFSGMFLRVFKKKVENFSFHS